MQDSMGIALQRIGRFGDKPRDHARTAETLEASVKDTLVRQADRPVPSDVGNEAVGDVPAQCPSRDHGPCRLDEPTVDPVVAVEEHQQTTAFRQSTLRYQVLLAPAVEIVSTDGLDRPIGGDKANPAIKGRDGWLVMSSDDDTECLIRLGRG
ncbi:hypothetical protein CIW48_18355 [Methylobacterium sp. P1-11]|uniref:hypothetical protein n=1 Tax=Methylobacterium sp. P1-11 TaxID=2024616 RepID=UPI0011EBE968|nr:hypothetical protein [Methylobacterium sp. P1-11]KAA0122474.1 hypothetical protein CIW48_18355 [Methylobacterium sp. P1-11]